MSCQSHSLQAQSEPVSDHSRSDTRAAGARRGARSLPAGRLASTKSKPYAHSAGRTCARSPLPLCIPQSRRAPARRLGNQHHPKALTFPLLHPRSRRAPARRPDKQSYPHLPTPSWSYRIRQRNASPLPHLPRAALSSVSHSPGVTQRHLSLLHKSSLTSHPPYASRQGFFLA